MGGQKGTGLGVAILDDCFAGVTVWCARGCEEKSRIAYMFDSAEGQRICESRAAVREHSRHPSAIRLRLFFPAYLPST